VTETHWNEFLDKLDFVELTDRWNLLPLHWLDNEFPSNLSESARVLVEGLIEAKGIDDEEARLARAKTLCAEYRGRLSSESISLDSRLTPPGSRVTLSFLNLNNLGEGDCLITLGAWDRVGYSIAKTAHPGGEHTENVGENPTRKEPGVLNFRHLLLFPDKGTPSPRSFRSLCEKTLRQARGLGARSISMTHLHLPQTGLADRFAAAEVVSAVRAMLRESPGTTVDILAFTHRNFEDYEHWFESLKSLTRAEEGPGERETTPPPVEETDEASSEVGDTLRNLAKRSSDLANEATASVKGWFSQSSKETETPPVVSTSAGFSYSHRQILNDLYLRRDVEKREWNPEKAEEHYLHCLHQTVRCEAGVADPLELLPVLSESWRLLGPASPLHRYYRLLALRLQDPADPDLVESLVQEAEHWDDCPMLAFLGPYQKDTAANSAKRSLPPVYPAGSRTSALD
jgi:hypothetical protein